MNNITKLAILLISTLSTFVIKAYIRLPIPQRGISAEGIYHFLNAIQFKETAVFTFLIILPVAFKWLKIRLNWSIVLAIAGTLSNLGLMIIDARYQTYLPYIEEHISSHYGSPIQIYTLAGGCLLVAVLIGAGAIFTDIVEENLSNRVVYKLYYRLGYFLLVFLGFYLLLFTSPL